MTPVGPSCQARELRIVYSPVEQAGPLPEVGRPAEAAALLRARLGSEAVEVCLVLLLTAKHRLIAVHEISRGTLDCCLVYPRDVFTAALLANAAAVVVGHNHPSGDPAPSPDDHALCTRLTAAGELLGVALLDFVVVAGRQYYSFSEHGQGFRAGPVDAAGHGVAR